MAWPAPPARGRDGRVRIESAGDSAQFWAHLQSSASLVGSTCSSSSCPKHTQPALCQATVPPSSPPCCTPIPAAPAPGHPESGLKGKPECTPAASLCSLTCFSTDTSLTLLPTSRGHCVDLAHAPSATTVSSSTALHTLTLLTQPPSPKRSSISDLHSHVCGQGPPAVCLDI